MSEWWTYRLSDLLMFSARTYQRLFELYNLAIWPAQLVALLAGLALVGSLAIGGRAASRLAALLLGVAWLWIAWGFHLRHYATINTAAPWFAAAFALQGLMLFWLAAKPTPRLARFDGDPVSSLGLATVALAVLAYPALPLLQGRSLSHAEVFGVAPDPTAVATLGVLFLTCARWPLWLIPLGWCAVSGATLMELRAPLAWLPVVVAVVMLAAAWIAKRRWAGR